MVNRAEGTTFSPARIPSPLPIQNTYSRKSFRLKNCDRKMPGYMESLTRMDFPDESLKAGSGKSVNPVWSRSACTRVNPVNESRISLATSSTCAPQA